MKANSPIFKSPERGFRGAKTKFIKNKSFTLPAFAMSIDNQAVSCKEPARTSRGGVKDFIFHFLKNLNLYKPLLTPARTCKGAGLLTPARTCKGAGLLTPAPVRMPARSEHSGGASAGRANPKGAGKV